MRQDERDANTSKSFNQFLLIIGILTVFFVLTLSHPIVWGGRDTQIIISTMEWVGLPITIFGYTIFTYFRFPKGGVFRKKFKPFFIGVALISVIVIFYTSFFVLLLICLSSGGGR